MSKKHFYKGQKIDIRTYPLRGGGWTSHFAIEKHQELDTRATLFETGRRFPTSEAALEAAISAATRCIDNPGPWVASGACGAPLAFGLSRVRV